MTSSSTILGPGTHGATDASSTSIPFPRRSPRTTSRTSKSSEKSARRCGSSDSACGSPGKPNTVLISNGLSAMGIALPGGIAAKLHDPNRRVVTLSGDGGFLMSVHELETAKREGAATVNLIFRDGGLGSIRWKQAAKFGRTTGTEFGNPDFTAVAEAFGVRGFRVDRASELEAVIEEALETKGATVVDIPVDYSDNPFLAAGR